MQTIKNEDELEEWVYETYGPIGTTITQQQVQEISNEAKKKGLDIQDAPVVKHSDGTFTVDEM